MAENAYDYISRVILKNDNSEYVFKYLTDFNEYEHEILVKTGVPIEGLKRGWVGDLFYETSDAINIHTGDKVKGHTFHAGFKNVLLARFLVTSDSNRAVEWEYTFLKD